MPSRKARKAAPTAAATGVTVTAEPLPTAAPVAAPVATSVATHAVAHATAVAAVTPTAAAAAHETRDNAVAIVRKGAVTWLRTRAARADAAVHAGIVAVLPPHCATEPYDAARHVLLSAPAYTDPPLCAHPRVRVACCACGTPCRSGIVRCEPCMPQPFTAWCDACK